MFYHYSLRLTLKRAFRSRRRFNIHLLQVYNQFKYMYKKTFFLVNGLIQLLIDLTSHFRMYLIKLYRYNVRIS